MKERPVTVCRSSRYANAKCGYDGHGSKAGRQSHCVDTISKTLLYWFNRVGTWVQSAKTRAQQIVISKLPQAGVLSRLEVIDWIQSPILRYHLDD